MLHSADSQCDVGIVSGEEEAVRQLQTAINVVGIIGSDKWGGGMGGIAGCNSHTKLVGIASAIPKGG